MPKEIARGWLSGLLDRMRADDPAKDAFLRSPEAFRGHPTSPGKRDPYIARFGREDTPHGTPGVPRLQPAPLSQGPGLPGPTPSGPLQPGVRYAGAPDE